MDWLLRGIGMSFVHVAARVLLGFAIVQAQEQSLIWKTLALCTVVLVALVWGGIDGLLDGRAHEEPDDYQDLTVRWLLAGIVTGIVSSIVCWLLAKFVFAGMGQNSFAVEVFAGGSFVALLVFIPALIAAAFGRAMARRGHRKNRDRAEQQAQQVQEHPTEPVSAN